VGEQVADEHPLLPGGRELGPVRCYRLVDVEPTVAGQEVRRQGRDALGRRHGDADGVLVPRAIVLRIGVAAPEVDHRLAADGDGDRRPQLAPLREVALELVGDTVEAVVAMALNVHGVYPS
jgi:hypothetical protein